MFGMRVTVVLTSLVLPGLPAWLSLGRLAGGTKRRGPSPSLESKAQALAHASAPGGPGDHKERRALSC